MNLVFAATPAGGTFAAPPPISWAASLAAHAAVFSLVAAWGEVGPLPPLPEPKPLEVTFTATPQATASPLQLVSLTATLARPAAVSTPAQNSAIPQPAVGAELRNALPIPEAAPAALPTIAAQANPAAVSVQASSPGVAAATAAMAETALPTAHAKPLPMGDESSQAAATQARWHELLRQKLGQLKRYPLAARRLGQEGVVVIDLRVAADGSTAEVAIRQGSAYPLLDQAALRLVREAVAALQGSLAPGRIARLEVPIAYRLRES